jgi:hypothetical protein
MSCPTLFHKACQGHSIREVSIIHMDLIMRELTRSLVTLAWRDHNALEQRVRRCVSENIFMVKNIQRSAKKLMQHSADGGYDRRQIHPRGGGHDHGIPLA